MKTIQELQDERNHKVRSAQDIEARASKDNRELTAEEKKAVKECLDEADNIATGIKALEEDAALRARIKKEADALSQPAQRVTNPGSPGSGAEALEASNVRVVPAGKRFGALKAFKGKNAEVDAYKSAMWLAATFYGNHKAERWLSQNYGPNWRNAMSEGTNTAGGYLVPDEMTQAIIDLREQYGVFRQNTRIRAMASDTLTIPRIASHITAAFTGEAVALSSADMAFDNVQLVAKKLGAYTLISTELAEDAIVSIVDEVTRDFAWALALKEDQCGFIGDGTPTYGGIQGLTSYFTAGSRAGAVDATSGHDTFEEVDVADLARLMAKLPDYARMNAKFFCSRPCAELVFGRIKTNGGGNTINDFNGGTGPNYLGYPIVISQVLPTSTSTINDTFMLAFGDLAMASSMGERRGLTVKRSDDLKFLEDQIVMKVTQRFDINIHDVGDANNAGAIVALIGNT